VCRARSWKQTLCLADQAIDLCVLPAIVVMGQDQLVYTGCGGQASAGGPSAMAPATMGGIFDGRGLSVGNQHIGPPAKIRKGLIGGIGIEFMICGDNERALLDVQAIGKALLGMA